MTYDEMVRLREQLGYRQFTGLQEKVFGIRRTYTDCRLWICGDTSSGKTLIPCLLYTQARREVKKNVKMLYMVPYRALAMQKYKEMKIAMEKLFGQHMNIVISTAEYKEDDESILAGAPDIAIIIYEKAYIFHGRNEFIRFYDYIVFDEFGIVADDERGVKADLLMLWSLKSKNHVVVLSTPYINWEDYIKTYDFFEIREERRPVRLNTIPIVRETQKVSYKLTCEEPEGDGDKILAPTKEFLYNCGKNLTHGFRVLLCVNEDYDPVKLAQVLCLEEGLAEFFTVCEKNEFRRKAELIKSSELEKCLDEQLYHFFCRGIGFLTCGLPDVVREFVLTELKDNAKEVFRVIICTEEYMYCNKNNAYMLMTLGMTRNSIISGICRKHLAADHNIIIFINNRTEIHNIARDLYKRLTQEGILGTVERPENGQTYKKMLMLKIDSSDNDDILSGVLEEDDCQAIFSGIGIHSAALPQDFREYIEQLLHERSNQIKIVVSTETLAFGINSNVDVVIIADMMNNGTYMNLNEYNNCAGRAGRMQNGVISEKQEGYIYSILNAKRLDHWFRLTAQTVQKVENTLARLDADHIALYVLSMFRPNKNMMQKGLIQEFSALPMPQEILCQQMKDILQLLTERGLLKCFTDEFWADEPLYCLSAAGEMMKSYPISVQTYDRIKCMLYEFEHTKKLPLFDLIFYLCETEPMKKAVDSIFSGAHRYSLDEKLFQSLVKYETKLFSRGFLEEGVISVNLYTRLKKEMRKDKEIRLHIKAVLALICWASGVKNRYIYKTFSLPYGLIKQIGEQMSYLLEVTAAVAYGKIDTLDFCSGLMGYSTSLFSGIPSDVLTEFNITAISSIKRNLVASLNLLIRIYNRNEKKPENEEREQIENILKQVNRLPTQCREKVRTMANEILYGI